MKVKILVPVLLFGMILFACSKKSDDVATATTDSGKYTTSDEILIDQVAIYTSDGVITDQDAINDYITRNIGINDQPKFHLGQTSAYNDAIKVSLEFLYGEKVTYNGTTMEIVTKQDSLILISQYDSTTVTNPVTLCDYVIQKVPAITPQTACPTCTTYRPTYPILLKGSNYYIPVLTVAVKSGECSTLATPAPMINVLSNSLTANLGTKDSVLVQVGRIALGK